MELPRGMKDFEQDELEKIELVRKKFLEISKLFGFKRIEPSPIELLSTLEAKSGSTIRDEIYYFKDKGERDVALRFDFTVGLTRYVVSQKSLKLPAKISSFGGVWRYDEPQKGRYRFFHQWNIEIYGKPSIESEAEVIEFTSRLFDALGLKHIIVDINHRSLVESYIKSVLGTEDKAKISDILRAVDKTSKKSKNEILSEYQKKGYSKEKLEKILEFSKIKGSLNEVEMKFDVSKLESWSDLKNLWDSIQNRDVKNIRINFGIVRGLDYYSGMVFEVFDEKSDLGALAGGGRYDSLAKAFGREDLGATGVAGGVERIILTMEEQEITKLEQSKSVSVLYVNDEMQKHATSLASKLRQKGIPVEIDLSGRSLKKQMESASESKFAVIVAPKEFSSKSLILRNMEDGKEKHITVDELLKNPKSILNL
ncbi:MAG: histidine--tRNA ligase [Nitrosopumilaceae archaeon]|nr:histidine--tRNA ligase [Nitrosopumilaceae archaeon]